MRPHFYLLLLIIFSCCKSEMPEPSVSDSKNSASILVMNEGNFNWGNASIDLFYPDTKEFSKSVFEVSNNRPLGDVLQSAKLINGQLWLVVNNSGKIEVVDTASFKSIATITGLNSPRFMHHTAGKVYVTNLYSDKIAVINATSYSVEGYIEMPGWTEQIEGESNDFYCINKDSNQLMKHSISSSISSKIKPSGILFDLKKAAGSTFCFSYSSDTLFVFKTQSLEEDTFAGTLDHVPNKVMYCEVNMSWYIILGNKLMSLNGSSLNLVYELNSGSLYGAACIGDEFYLSNAKDYVTNSELIRINLKGDILDQEPGGRITNGFLKLN